jgi:hypothetical protein
MRKAKEAKFDVKLVAYVTRRQHDVLLAHTAATAGIDGRGGTMSEFIREKIDEIGKNET